MSIEFTPCVESPHSGRICVPVGKPMSFDAARAFLERHYPHRWRACEAIPQPSHLVPGMIRRANDWRMSRR